MNSISSIIKTLSLKEKQEFTQLLKKKNKRHDSKNVQLFKLLEESGNQKNLDIIIYGKQAKGAYHALCKRLHDSLIDFVAGKQFEIESSEEMDVLKLLIVSRSFFEHKQYNIGFKTINKAELKAKSYNLYSILNEIYYTKIQYAHQDSSIVLNTLIEQFNTNKELVRSEENFTLFYASVKNEIQNASESLTEILKSNFKKFDISISQNLSYKSFFKILEIITQTANIGRNYHTILPFIEKTYGLLQEEERLIEKQLFYHIQVLYYVANAYFRNRNFKTSHFYLSKMEEQMEFQNNKYYNRFFPQYTLLKAFNLNYTGQYNKAIYVLETFEYKKYKDQLSYILDLQLMQIVFYFQQSEFKKALQKLNKLYHSDIWYTEKTSVLWVIKKNLIEILLFMELDYFDLIESRLKSFKKKYVGYLKDKNESEVLTFFNLIRELHTNPEKLKSPGFITEINNLNIAQNPTNGDLFDVSFYAWLKTKTEGDGLYKTTLRMLEIT